MRFVINIMLCCFHLCFLSLYGQHIKDNLFETFENTMDAICPFWKYTLLSTCCDGASNMTSQVYEIVICVSNQVKQEGCYLI